MNNTTSKTSNISHYTYVLCIAVISYGLGSVFNIPYIEFLVYASNAFLVFMVLCFIIALLALTCSEQYRNRVTEMKKLSSVRNPVRQTIQNGLCIVALMAIAFMSGWTFSIILCAMTLLLLTICHIYIAKL